MPPKSEFPRRSPEDLNPQGVSFIPNPTFKSLTPEQQARVRQGEDIGEVVGKDSVTPGAVTWLTNQERLNQLYDTIRTQNETAKVIFEKLSLEGKKNFRDALAHFLADERRDLSPRKNQDGKWVEGPNTSNLYTALDTVMRKDRAFLESTYTLNNLWKEAKRLEVEEKREKLSRKYAKDLLSLIPDGSVTDEQLFLILNNQSAKEWHEAIAALLKLGLLDRVVADFEATAYAKDPKNPHRTGRVTEGFLSLINPEKEKELVGSFSLENGENYDLFRLFTKADLETESKILGHCVGDGNTYYFKIRGDNPSHAIISLRQRGTPKYTIELDLTKHKLLQFRGGGNTPVNSLPEDSELPLKTFQVLSEAGLRVDSVAENFSYSILRHNNQYEAMSDLTKDYILGNLDKEVVKGELSLDETTTEEEFAILASIPGLSIDTTRLTQEVKDSVHEVKGSIVDYSTDTSYKNLTYIGGGADLPNLSSAQGLENLTYIGGDAEFLNLTSAEGLQSLTSIGNDADFGSLTSAEGLQSLTSIGNDAGFVSLISAEGLQSLTSIGNDAYFGSLTSAEGLQSLSSIGDIAVFHNLTSAQGLENLASIGGIADFNLSRKELEKIPALIKKFEEGKITSK